MAGGDHRPGGGGSFENLSEWDVSQRPAAGFESQAYVYVAALPDAIFVGELAVGDYPGRFEAAEDVLGVSVEETEDGGRSSQRPAAGDQVEQSDGLGDPVLSRSEAVCVGEAGGDLRPADVLAGGAAGEVVVDDVEPDAGQLAPLRKFGVRQESGGARRLRP